jgi:molybdopterin-guanine dinucleotide biosynthesis protein A
MTEPAPEVTGVVLAGGESRRFEDGDKALATLAGETFLERVLGALAEATTEPPVVAVRTEAQRDRFASTLSSAHDVRFVLDGTLTGPVAGLVAAAEAASTPWLFAVGCDMPLLDSDAVARTCDLATGPDGCQPDAVVPESGGYHEPLHAVYRRSAVRNSREGLSGGDGFRVLLGELDEVRYVDTTTLPAVVRRSLRNVNTVSELERIAATDEVHPR